MGSKGSQTVTQSGTQNQQYTPNAPIGGMVQNAGQMATTAAAAPFQQPVAPVAPFNAFQGLGFGETLGLQGMAQPYFNTAGNYLAASASPITGAQVANYLNPMTANVTAQLQNIFGQQNVQNTGNLVQSAGGVGADRVGVGQANMANQQTLAAGQVYSQLYQQALAAAEQNKQMQAGAGFAFGQMGPAAQAAQQNAINQLLGVGGQQQQLSQAQMNAIYQNQLAQIAYPFQTAQYLSGITAGLAPAMGGQTQGSYSGQTTYPSPSPFAQALGVGTGLLGMFGGMGGMGALGGTISGLSGTQSAVSGMPFFGGGYYAPGTTYIGGNPYPMYDEGGAVDGEYGKLADREKYQEYASVIPYAAQGNPIGQTFLKDVGYDDGGGIDPTLGQPAPMGLNLDPGSGLPFPGAGKVRGSPVPSMQLPTGQGGKSGLYGQQMIMHPPPSMPQGGSQQQPQLGQLAGSLGKSLGSLGNGAFGGLGSLGGAAGPLDLGGAGVADTLGVGDIAAGAGDAAALFALVKRGGRIPRMAPGGMAPMVQPSTPIPPMAGPTPPSMAGPMAASMPPPGTGPQAFPPPGAPAQPPPLPLPGASMPPGVAAPGQMPASTPPGGAQPPGVLPAGQQSPPVPPPMGATMQRPPMMPGAPPPLSFTGTSPFSGPAPSRPPGMDDGGNVGPPLDIRPDVARPQQQVPLPRPRPTPPPAYHQWSPGHERDVASVGGGVHPMMAGEGFDDGGDVDYVPPTGPPTPMFKPTEDWLPPSVPMSDAPPGSVPEMGLGEREPQKSQDRLPSAPAMVSPADAAAPTKDQDQVPMPTPRPVQTTTIRPMGPDTEGDGMVHPRPYPEHPLDPNDPNYDPVLDPHNPRYNPNDPRLVFVDPTTRGDPRAPGVAGGSYRPGMATNPMPGPMGSSPVGNFQRPFPGATDPNNFARRTTDSPWFALARAGARMAQTPGPIGSVIGAGIGEASRTLEGQRAALDSEEAINQRAEHLGLLADQHLRQWSQMTPYQQQETDIQRRRLALMQDKMKELTPYQHAQIEARIRTLHPEFDQLDPAQQDEIRMGIYAHPELISGGTTAEPPPKVGDTKQFKQGLGRWDGKQWVPAG